MSLSDRCNYLKTAKASIYNNAREGGEGAGAGLKIKGAPGRGMGTSEDEGIAPPAPGQMGCAHGGLLSTPALQCGMVPSPGTQVRGLETTIK